MIKILDREPTPNPNAFKFHTNKTLLENGNLSFGTEQEAEKLPLADALFNTGNVTAVMISDDFVSISAEPFADWDSIKTSLEANLTDFPFEEVEKMAAEAKAIEEERRANREPNELLDKINEMIDMFVRPALANDGGGLEVIDIVDQEDQKVVQVKYQGACGSCPSATSGTIMAIENLLKSKVDPDLQVQAV